MALQVATMAGEADREGVSQRRRRDNVCKNCSNCKKLLFAT